MNTWNSIVPKSTLLSYSKLIDRCRTVGFVFDVTMHATATGRWHWHVTGPGTVTDTVSVSDCHSVSQSQGH